MQERRRQPRIQIMYYLEVEDTTSERLYGQLLDITTEGLNLLCKEREGLGQDYHFRLQLPSAINGKTAVEFNAESRWCKRDVNPDYYSIGFKFTDISKADMVTVMDLIDRYAFSTSTNGADS